MKKWTDEYPFNGKSSNVIISVDLWKTIIDEHNRLAELEDKIEQGKMIELPCKVGDTLWVAEENYCAPCNITVDRIEIIEDNYIRVVDNYDNYYSNEDFNKIVFLTKAEAEQKLKELQNARNE